VAQITVLKDPESLAAAAADRFTALTCTAIDAHDRAAVCLAGGRTPRRLYQLLADPTRPWRTRIDWSRVFVFWSDERHVPAAHAESNFGMASRALVDHVALQPDHVHRMRGERSDAGEAAREYQAAIAPFEPLDVVLLGMGPDGHIASIFPGSRLLHPSPYPPSGSERVAAVWVEHLQSWRITLTPDALLDARAILVLVSGPEKADAVRAALEDADDVTRWPAQLLRGAGGRVEWFMDAAAARSLAAPPA
jgi:6-phosphogluconolactonase